MPPRSSGNGKPPQQRLPHWASRHPDAPEAHEVDHPQCPLTGCGEAFNRIQGTMEHPSSHSPLEAVSRCIGLRLSDRCDPSIPTLDEPVHSRRSSLQQIARYVFEHFSFGLSEEARPYPRKGGHDPDMARHATPANPYAPCKAGAEPPYTGPFCGLGGTQISDLVGRGSGTSNAPRGAMATGHHLAAAGQHPQPNYCNPFDLGRQSQPDAVHVPKPGTPRPHAAVPSPLGHPPDYSADVVRQVRSDIIQDLAYTSSVGLGIMQAAVGHHPDLRRFVQTIPSSTWMLQRGLRALRAIILDSPTTEDAFALRYLACAIAPLLTGYEFFGRAKDLAFDELILGDLKRGLTFHMGIRGIDRALSPKSAEIVCWYWTANLSRLVMNHIDHIDVVLRRFELEPPATQPSPILFNRLSVPSIKETIVNYLIHESELYEPWVNQFINNLNPEGFYDLYHVTAYLIRIGVRTSPLSCSVITL